MAKLTLIEITQDILSDMNSDEVNSISDTLESLQVAQIVKSTYFEMMGRRNWPHLRTLQSLDALADTEKPTHMKTPELVKELEWIKYNKRKSGETRTRYDAVDYKEPDQFLRIVNGYNLDDSAVQEVEDFSGVTFNIKNNAHPSYWTSFDDEYVVFNSFDSALESTLQESNTQTSCFVEPSWTMEDSHTPDMPSEMFPGLLAEAKSVCFVRIKQQADAKSEQQAERSMDWLSRKAFKNAGGIKLPNYARRSRT